MAVIQIKCQEDTKVLFDVKLKKYGFKTKEDFLLKMLEIFDEVEYVENGGTLINEHLSNSISATVKDSEIRLGNRTSKLLYEIAVNQSVILKTLQKDYMLLDDEITDVRSDVARQMKIKNDVLKYDELKE